MCPALCRGHCLQEGGVSGFLHAFIAEVFAMVRAHVAALGGNAVVSYIMKQCVFMENPSKNQVRHRPATVRTSEGASSHPPPFLSTEAAC